MKIFKRSFFKNDIKDKEWLERWVAQLEKTNNKKYSSQVLHTSLGKTQVYGLNTEREELQTLVIFPGARTSALFFDLNNGLGVFENTFRIFMIETNGLPNLSDGGSPDIKGLGYGEWASEVFDILGIQQAFVAGASFGGLVCMKFSIAAPAKIKAVFLLNPGCLQPFSLSLKNLYYNILPIVLPTAKNVIKFLEKAVLYRPTHTLPDAAFQLLVDYEMHALKNYRDVTQKPYYMGEELKQATSDVYLLEGDKDLLFPYQQSVENAREKISGLKDVTVLSGVGHGIETQPEAMRLIKEKTEQILAKESVSAY